jgi:protein-tyrosine phosphatase
MLGRIYTSLRRRWRAARAVAAARADTRARLEALPMRRILVICYGNIYRSAFVGAWLRERLAGRAEVRSAGFHRKTGRPSPDRHIEMSRGFGVDLAAHRSALVTPEDLAWADTVILMDRHNWAALDELGVDHAKLVWLGALNDSGVEIADPYTLDDARALAGLRAMESASVALVAHANSRPHDAVT